MTTKPRIGASLLPFVAGMAVAIGAVGIRTAIIPQPEGLRVVGATTQAVVAGTDVAFDARVDTGASVTSVHCPPSAISIPDEAPDGADNVGKVATVKLVGNEGRELELECQIEGFLGIRNAEYRESRYQVRIPLIIDGVRRDSIVTLNDRSTMRYKLLIGRDLLRDSFVVDVSIDSLEPR